MGAENYTEQQFIKKLTESVESHISDEHFGVPKLAAELGMSRYTLHRKINSATKLSASQFIRQVRLKNAKEILRQTSATVSEVAYKVGFNSPVYFSKCFHDYYGYPPGKVGQREPDENNSGILIQSNKKGSITILFSVVSLIVLTVVLIVIFKPFSSKQYNLEKSI